MSSFLMIMVGLMRSLMGSTAGLKSQSILGLNGDFCASYLL